MSRKFKDYNIHQPMLLAPNLRDWLPKNHIVYFISDIVEDLDLSDIYSSYENKNSCGQPPIDPVLMLKILIYGYSRGIRSSRKIEKATHEDIGFRLLACDQHPDHDSIASFRTRHLKALASIFLQVLQLCQKSNLVKLGHVSLDGTKIKASANKSKSKTYKQFKRTKDELEKEIEKILNEAVKIDADEDEKYGKGKHPDNVPEHLVDREKRLEFIKKTLAEIEKEAAEEKASYEEEKKRMKQEDDEWMEETGLKFERRPPRNPTHKDTHELIKSRRNTTDYDSRILKEPTTGGFIQGYNCQLVVDTSSQVILAATVTNQVNDKQLVRPMLLEVVKGTGAVPECLSCDTGYFSERDVIALEKMGVEAFIPPRDQDRGKRRRSRDSTETITSVMREKLQSESGRAAYSLRKRTVEPVIGQIKEQKSFRQFLLRGLAKVQAEWQLVALSLNIGKLHTAKMIP